MAKTELRLKYKSEGFGKPFPDGTYGIRNDLKTYELLVDEVPVISLSLEYERFSSKKPNYAAVFISYDNNYFLSKNTEYLNKGYATLALDTITESLLREGDVPRITLNIAKDNLASQRVAEKVGYKYIKNDEYSVYHPNAIKMIEEGLSYLKDTDMEIYDLQMHSALVQYRRYVEACLPKEESKKL